MSVKVKQILLTAILSLWAINASAGCWLDGIEYPEGTVKGAMVCGDDGYWRPM